MHKLKKRSRHTVTHCNCRGQTKTTVYLQWPIQLQRTQKTAHDKLCPYATCEDAMTDLSVRFSTCVLALKRKVDIAIAITQIAGVSRVSHSLVHYRVVPESSPAFRLVQNVHDAVPQISDRRLAELYLRKGIQKAVPELQCMFQLQEASPYDRLPDGRSLLHVGLPRILCDLCAKINSTTAPN